MDSWVGNMGKRDLNWMTDFKLLVSTELSVERFTAQDPGLQEGEGLFLKYLFSIQTRRSLGLAPSLSSG